jgi:AcrR family transcriptional regulator
VSSKSEIAMAKVRRAAADLLLADGPNALTIDAVARRSGVAKTTIYRRWDNARELLVDTLATTLRPQPTPNTGSLRGDLEEFFQTDASERELDELAQRLAGLLYSAINDPSTNEVLGDLVVAYTTPMRTIVELAQGRGEVDPELDLDVAVELIQGPFLFGFLVRRRTYSPDDLATLLDHIVAGLTVHAATSTASVMTSTVD